MSIRPKPYHHYRKAMSPDEPLSPSFEESQERGSFALFIATVAILVVILVFLALG